MRASSAELLFNPALGSVILAAFGAKWASAGRDEGLDSVLDPFKTMLVLPMTFHQATVDQIAAMKFPTGLDRALAECPAIRSGLHSRVIEFMPLSMKSLLMAHACKWISFGDKWTVRVRQKLPASLLAKCSDDTKVRLRAAERLGVWFRERSTSHLFQFLGVTL